MPQAQIPNGMDKGYRREVESLAAEGWTVSRTRNGHLKMTHPETDKTITGSLTPSDRRSFLNLRSQCRSALRNEATPHRPGVEIDDQEFRETLRMKKTKASRKNRHVKHRSKKRPATKTHQAPQVSETPAFQPENDTRSDQMNAHVKTDILENDETRCAATDPDVKTEMPSAPASHPAEPRTESAQTASPDLNLPKAAPPAESGPAPAKGNAIAHVPADIFDLVMGIAAGEVETLEVTEDMIGGRIAIRDGVMYFLEKSGSSCTEMSGQPACKTKTAPGSYPEIPKNQERAHSLRQSIEKIIDQYADPMTISDITVLISEDLKSENPRSTWTRVYNACEKLFQQGRLFRWENDLGTKVYSFPGNAG